MTEVLSADQAKCDCGYHTDEDNYTAAARFAGITFSQGCQFDLMLGHLVGRLPAPGSQEVQQFLGYFDTAKEAYSVYCAAANRYYGEFARTA